MRKSDTYFNNLDLIESRTDKVLLNKKDVGEILNISQPTVRVRFGEYFKNGIITTATLAEVLTKGVRI